MVRAAALMAMGLLIYPSYASAKVVSLSTITGPVLVDVCRVDRGSEFDSCSAYILGVADALQYSGISCIPASDAFTIQTLAIVKRYIKDNPSKWGLHASQIVRAALTSTFPCK